MSRPVIFEVVPALLSIETEGSDQVSRVHTISEELQGESRRDFFLELEVWPSCGVTDDAVVSTPEDSREWVVSL